MIINNIIQNINQPQNITFNAIKYKKTQQFYLKNPTKDILNIENIKSIICHETGELKRIIYATPQKLSKAIEHFATSNNPVIKNCIQDMYLKHYIKSMLLDIKNSSELGDINVKSLHGLGASALVFETTENTIVKITPRNHFPDDREPADFDAPIIKRGKLHYGTHFYIVEKLSQNNISQNEIKTLCEHITSQGYEMFDIIGFSKQKFLTRQFGKDKNGHLFLLDPECAVIEKQRLPILKRIKRTINEWLKMALEEMD